MQQGDQALAVGVQEAEVACAAKALGQHVLANQPEEIDTAERAPFRLAGFRVALAEAHPAILAGEDILFSYDAPVEVTTDGDQGLLAAATRLAMRYPSKTTSACAAASPRHSVGSVKVSRKWSAGTRRCI